MKDNKGHGGSYVYSTKAIIDMLEQEKGQVYVAVAIQRWVDVTGGEPVMLSS